MRIQGACHCRDISYEAVIDPARVSICHCTDCQALTGFELRSGSPKVYIKTGDSGAKRAQVFCPRCGSPIYAHAMENPKTYGLRVGCITQRRELVPTLQIWCDSALSWTGDVENIPKRPPE